jgi:ketosteroid isomerase-like protein
VKTAIQVHDELQRTFVAGDVEAMLNLFDENCVIREAPDLPFGGDWKGREGVTALAARMAELFDMVPTPLGLYEVDDTHFITHVSMEMTSKTTGVKQTIPILEMYTVRDGLIVEAFPYYWNAGSLTAPAPAEDGVRHRR